MTPKEALDRLNKKWKYITKDSYGAVYLFTEKPYIYEDLMWWHVVCDSITDIEDLFEEPIEFESDNWKECLVEREPDYSA